jgi:predicted CXXCH cytochrome family protein
MEHKHGELTAHYDENCQKCHSAQDNMYRGKADFMAEAKPSFKAETLDCDSCHASVIGEGNSSLSGIKKMCVECHEEGYDEMVDGWQEMIRDEIKEADELLDSLEMPIKTSDNREASSLYKEASSRISFVKKDNSLGAHNFDLADELVTDAISKLKKCQGMIK